MSREELLAGLKQEVDLKNRPHPRRRSPVTAPAARSTLVDVSITVEVPEPFAGRLAAEAARRGRRPEDLVVEAIEGRYSDTEPVDTTSEAHDALEAFIGCGDSGDPDWASGDIKELRREAATRKLANGV